MSPPLTGTSYVPEQHRGWNPLASGMALGVLVLTVLAVSALTIRMMGLKGLLLAQAMFIFGSFLVWMSIKEPSVVLLAWFFSMSGFQRVGMIRMPGLPDFSFARLFMIWVIIMLAVWFLVLLRKPRGNYLPDVLLAVQVFYLLIQLNVKQSPQFHAWTVSSLAPFLAYLYVKNLVTRRRSLVILFVGMVVLLTYYSITSIAEHFELRALVWPKYILNRSLGKYWLGRSRGPFLQPAVFGTIMAMFSLLVFFMIVQRRRLKTRIMLAGLLITGVLGVFYSYTRSCWMALAGGMAVIGVLRPTYRRAMIIGFLIAVPIAMLGAINVNNNEQLHERLENTQTIENRLGTLATALRMIRDHPLFGVGYFRYTDYRDLYNQGAYIPFYGFVSRSMSEKVVIHDIYLGRMAEEGTISLLLLLGFGIATAHNAMRKWRANPQERWFNRDVLAVLVGIIVAYLIGGLFIDYRYFDLINVIPFVASGILNGYGNERYGIS